MEIKVKNTGEVAVLELKGRLDLASGTARTAGLLATRSHHSLVLA